MASLMGMSTPGQENDDDDEFDDDAAVDDAEAMPSTTKSVRSSRRSVRAARPTASPGALFDAISAMDTPGSEAGATPAPSSAKSAKSVKSVKSARPSGGRAARSTASPGALLATLSAMDTPTQHGDDDTASVDEEAVAETAVEAETEAAPTSAKSTRSARRSVRAARSTASPGALLATLSAMESEFVEDVAEDASSKKPRIDDNDDNDASAAAATAAAGSTMTTVAAPPLSTRPSRDTASPGGLLASLEAMHNAGADASSTGRVSRDTASPGMLLASLANAGMFTTSPFPGATAAASPFVDPSPLPLSAATPVPTAASTPAGSAAPHGASHGRRDTASPGALLAMLQGMGEARMEEDRPPTPSVPLFNTEPSPLPAFGGSSSSSSTPATLSFAAGVPAGYDTDDTASPAFFTSQLTVNTAPPARQAAVAFGAASESESGLKSPAAPSHRHRTPSKSCLSASKKGSTKKQYSNVVFGSPEVRPRRQIMDGVTM